MRWWLYPVLLAATLTSCGRYQKDLKAYRAEHRSGLVTGERAPLTEAELPWIEYFPDHTQWVVKAKVVLTPTSEPFELPTYSGITRTYRQFGIASFLLRDTLCTLHLYENMMFAGKTGYEDYLFLPFKDQTTGSLTYGGGRYLNLSKTDASDGDMKIDFNKAYNPWCAYSDGYNCPIPPRENDLPVAVLAGERMYQGPVARKPQ